MLFFPSEVRVAWVFLGISLGLHLWEIPWKTQATPPSDGKGILSLSQKFSNMKSQHYFLLPYSQHHAESCRVCSQSRLRRPGSRADEDEMNEEVFAALLQPLLLLPPHTQQAGAVVNE